MVYTPAQHIPTPSRLSSAEASIYTAILVSTLRYWRHNGTGPVSYSIGARVYHDAADLDAWIADKKAATLRGGTSGSDGVA